MCAETVFPFQSLCKGLHAVIFWESLGLLRLWNTNSVLNCLSWCTLKKTKNPALSTTALEQTGSLQHYLLKLLQQPVPAVSGKSCPVSWEVRAGWTSQAGNSTRSRASESTRLPRANKEQGDTASSKQLCWWITSHLNTGSVICSS